MQISTHSAAYNRQHGGETRQVHTTVHWDRGVTSVQVIAREMEEYRTSSMDVPSPTSDSGEAYRLHDLVRLRLPPTPRFTPTEVQNPARVRIGRCFGINGELHRPQVLDCVHTKERSGPRQEWPRSPLCASHACSMRKPRLLRTKSPFPIVLVSSE